MKIGKLTSVVEDGAAMEKVGKTYLQEASLIPALLDLVQIALWHPPLQDHEEETVDEEDYGVYDTSIGNHV